MTPTDLIALPHIRACLAYQYKTLGVTLEMRERWERLGMMKWRYQGEVLELVVGAVVIIRIHSDGRVEMPKARSDWLHFESFN